MELAVQDVRLRDGLGAVTAMALCAGLLVASEFLPVSLLTPLATDLGITEGQAGQAISISGLFAVVTSLTAARLTGQIDRRVVQAGFTMLMILSGLIVTFAPSYPVLMLGRAFLGIAVGGFWSMSTAIVLRLLPQARVPEGLAIVNAGVAFSGIIAAPLGSWLGDLIGWRGTFFALVPLALLAMVWQWTAMPPLPAKGQTARSNPLTLLARPQVVWGMLSVFLLFMGQFALFTYLRPYLEDAAGLTGMSLSLAFLGLGLSGLAGTWAVTRILPNRPFAPVIVIPAVMAVVACALVALHVASAAVILLLCLWGFFATAAPVGWGTWLARTLRDEAEAGGGLQVAVIQLAIMSGAALGGVVFDNFGWATTFAAAAVLLAGSTLSAIAAWRNAGTGRHH